MLEFQLEMARKNTGLNLGLDIYNPDGHCRYTLVEIEEETGGESTLSRSCNNMEIYEVLYSLNKVIERAGIQKQKIAEVTA